MKNTILTILLCLSTFCLHADEQTVVRQVILEKILEQGFAASIEEVEQNVFLFRGGPLESIGQVVLVDIYITTPRFYLSDSISKQAQLTWEFPALEEQGRQGVGAVHDFKTRFSILYLDESTGDWISTEDAFSLHGGLDLDVWTWLLLLVAGAVIAISYYSGWWQMRKSKEMLKKAEALQAQEKQHLETAREMMVETHAITKLQCEILAEIRDHLQAIRIKTDLRD